MPVPRVHSLPEVPISVRLDEALACCPRTGHLGRAVGPRGETVGVVAMEDLVETYVGEVRDATHARDQP